MPLFGHFWRAGSLVFVLTDAEKIFAKMKLMWYNIDIK